MGKEVSGFDCKGQASFVIAMAALKTLQTRLRFLRSPLHRCAFRPMGMQCSEHFRMVRLPTIAANSSGLRALQIFLILWRRPWCLVQTELTGWARATWACFAL